MNKLIALFLCLGLSGLLYAACESIQNEMAIKLIGKAPPANIGLNLQRMWEDQGIGLKLTMNLKDAENPRIFWSIRVPNEPALKVLGDGYYLVPARAIFQRPTVDETPGDYCVDIILEGKHPGALFNNRVAAAVNIGQNHLQIMTRLQFMDNGELHNRIDPEPDTPLFTRSYLATETFSGQQVIQLHLLPFKEAYRLYKLYYEDQSVPLSVSKVLGKDYIDGVLNPPSPQDTSALGLMTEFSVAGQLATQMPVYEYAQSPIGF